MTTTIQILDDKLINKIAAGEVIENPSSVVKELVENSIDAKAKNIVIEIKNSGFSSIKVEDDGIGMTKEDAILSFERHATSKIKTFEDLININSMGFRGEALASISSISKVDLKTSKDEIATHLKLDGSKIISIEEVARTRGTTIEVKSLFFNVPVRKKFQKSLTYINSEIIKVASELALANPNIGFKLILNEKEIFTCESSALDKKLSFTKRIKELYLDDFSASMELDFEVDHIKIFGIISYPKNSKKNKSSQHVVINNRVVSSYLISKFVKDAYGTAIQEDDFPIFILNIEIKNSFIDVNVHPQKKEIRISDSFFLKEAIKKAIENCFENRFSKEEYKISFNNEMSFKKDAIEQNSFLDSQSRIDDITPFEVDPKQNVFEKFDNQMVFEKIYEENEVLDFLMIDRFVFIESKYLRKFIKDQNIDSEMIVIDLGALQASLMFEKIKNKKASKMQNLLIPINITLKNDDIYFIEDRLNNFLEIGMDIKVTSKNVVTIEAIDEMINFDNLKDLFLAILDDFKAFDKSNRLDDLYEKKIAKDLLIFSKKKRFLKNEAYELLKKLKELKNINFDPLGNNLFIRLDKEKIQWLFKN